jgi:hypothetical protein
MRAQRIVAGSCIVVHKWEFHGPVVRKIQRAPVGVVEALLGNFEDAHVGKLGLAIAKSHVFRGIGGMTELELPAGIEEELFPRHNRRIRVGEVGRRVACHYVGRAAAQSRAGDQGSGGESKS